MALLHEQQKLFHNGFAFVARKLIPGSAVIGRVGRWRTSRALRMQFGSHTGGAQGLAPCVLVYSSSPVDVPSALAGASPGG